MDIQEAIQHAYDKAVKMPICECSKEHLQLAQWLEELVDIRNKSYSKGAVEQIMWERDMAIQQLNDLGIQFGEEVVRCKNCENRCTDNCPMYFEEWVDYDDGDYLERDIIYHDNTKDDWFCPMRKRMEWGD